MAWKEPAKAFVDCLSSGIIPFFYFHIQSWYKAMMPNRTSTTPEARFTQTSKPFFKNLLMTSTPPLRINHQSNDPKNTPITRIAADALLSLEIPKPAKTPTKERMVMGLVIVKKNVER